MFRQIQRFPTRSCRRPGRPCRGTARRTAYYLAAADPSLRITVLEARFAGFGASGRNGGWPGRSGRGRRTTRRHDLRGHARHRNRLRPRGHDSRHSARPDHPARHGGLHPGAARPAPDLVTHEQLDDRHRSDPGRVVARNRLGRAGNRGG
ncbi:FAD-dependent oxidoreductase [Mycolicibacterium fortuitum]|nr:FAD-dependent oxidoreductase [Mycolicibacterium fortuitum]